MAGRNLKYRIVNQYVVNEGGPDEVIFDRIETDSFWTDKDGIEYYVACRDQKSVIIDETGKILFQYDYDRVKELDVTHNFFTCSKNGKWGVVDFSQRVIIPHEYQSVVSKINSAGELFFVATDMKTGCYGLFHSDGEQLLDCTYSHDIHFELGYKYYSLPQYSKDDDGHRWCINIIINDRGEKIFSEPKRVYQDSAISVVAYNELVRLPHYNFQNKARSDNVFIRFYQSFEHEHDKAYIVVESDNGVKVIEHDLGEHPTRYFAWEFYSLLEQADLAKYITWHDS